MRTCGADAGVHGTASTFARQYPTMLDGVGTCDRDHPLETTTGDDLPAGGRPGTTSMAVLAAYPECSLMNFLTSGHSHGNIPFARTHRTSPSPGAPPQ